MSHHRHRPQRIGKGVTAFATTLALAVTGQAAIAQTAEAQEQSPVTVQARMRDHVGTDEVNGNCIRYAPTGDGDASAWVGSSGEALTAHGRGGRNCPGSLSTSTQSAIGFTPVATVDPKAEGVSGLGTITHYNNPVQTGAEHYAGVLEVQLLGTNSTEGVQDPVFTFPWTMWETPNNSATPADRTRFTITSPDETLDIDGVPYRMVIDGFAEDCEAGTPKNEWWTDEESTTKTQICASFSQVRSLEIKKQVEIPEGIDVEIPSFGFEAETTMGGLEGVDTFWDEGFALQPTAAGADGVATTEAHDVIVPNQTVKVTEGAVEGWRISDIVCEGVDVEADVASGSITFTGREVDTIEELPATCTFVNTPVMQPLQIEKSVGGFEVTEGIDWAIEKTVNPAGTADDPMPSGTEFTYTVTVTPTAGERTNGTYTTTLDITNPNAFPVAGVELVDEQCTVEESTLELDAGETRTVELSCTAPEVADGTNTAVITWTDLTADGAEQSAEASADYSFDDATVVPGEHTSVTIADTFPEFAEAYPEAVVDAADGVQTFTYTVTHVAPEGECRAFTNTASIVETGDEATADAHVCNTADLNVSKNVVTGLERTYAWDIEKSVEQSKVTITEQGTATADYTVTVTEGAATDANWSMTGQIVVVNPNQFRDAIVTVTDQASIGGECTVVDGVDAVIPAGGTKVFDYTCAFDEQPSSYDGVNTATVVWDGQDTPSTFEAAFTEADWQLDEKVKETTVTDTFPEFAQLGEPTDLVWSEEGKTHTFTYQHTFTADELPAVGECTTVTNVASLSTGGSAEADVEVCVEAGLAIEKTVEGSYDVTHAWSIEKSAGDPVVTDDASATLGYDVVVTHEGSTVSDVAVAGTITVSNPNEWEKGYVVTDVFAGAECTVADGEGTLAAGESVELEYTCAVPAGFEPGDEDTNVATVTTTDPDGAEVSTTSAPVAVEWAVTQHQDVVDVVDVFRDGEPVQLGTVTVGEDGALAIEGSEAVVDGATVTFTYEATAEDLAIGECTDIDNVATVVDGETELDRDETSTEVCIEADLAIEKTAEGSYDLTHAWSIEKSVDPTQTEIIDGDSATLGYDVVVTHEGTEVSNAAVSGTITVINPNEWDKDYVVTDVFAGAECTVADGEGTLAAGESVELEYTCEIPAGFEPGDEDTNVATVSATARDGGPMVVESNPVVVEWDVTEYDNPVEILDVFQDDDPALLGTITVGEDGALAVDAAADAVVEGNTVAFTYTAEITDLPMGDCTSVTNLAQVVSDEVLDEDDATSEICTEADLVITKSANASAEITYLWDIEKTADKVDFGVVDPLSEIVANYTVTVTPNGYEITAAELAGDITVTNPNAYKSVDVAITDVVSDDAWTCTVDGGELTLAAGETVTLSYSCDLAEGMEPEAEGVNTVTVTWGEGDAMQSVDFEQPYTVDFTKVNDVVNVKDLYDGDVETVLGTAEWNEEGTPTEFPYSVVVNVGNIAGKHSIDNVAWIVETEQDDDETITFEVPPPPCDKGKDCKPGLPKTGVSGAPAGSAITLTVVQTPAARRDED